jgi:BirA family biotin operon repressor/biotin-[acetyl-CoA-carboxylase] ligase
VPDTPETAARREAVLAALWSAGPQGCSGQALADRLGCSRTAVHRHVEALRRAGTPVDGVHDGYRLGLGADPVVPSIVESRLTPPLSGPVRWAPTTGSTNDDLAAAARSGAPEGLVIGADHQGAGRGRQGRRWESDAGDGLLWSVLLRPPLPAAEAAAIPVLVAVAVAEALGPDARIVWPNDIVISGETVLGNLKLAGILCEMHTDEAGVAWIVAGVGVNVHRAPVLAEGRWTPTCLADHGPPPRRTDLLVDLLTALAADYRALLDGRLDLPVRFAERDALADAPVTVRGPTTEQAGTARGIDAHGRLLLDTPTGRTVVHAGEVWPG